MDQVSCAGRRALRTHPGAEVIEARSWVGAKSVEVRHGERERLRGHRLRPPAAERARARRAVASCLVQSAQVPVCSSTMALLLITVRRS